MPTNVPKKPGMYWWRPPHTPKLSSERDRYEWEEATPEEKADYRKPRITQLRFLSDGSPMSYPEAEATYTGTWGPRIPSPDRLEAMYEATAEELTAADECGRPYCVWCYAERHCEVIPGTWDGVRQDLRTWIDHAPNCPWLRAQEAPDAHPAC